ncbi:MAG: aminomethyltransferase beta-barrel domain-containing protein [Acidimicrobiales bacterium]
MPNGTVYGHQIRWEEPHHRVAEGQSVVFYIDDVVVGSATAC